MGQMEQDQAVPFAESPHPEAAQAPRSATLRARLRLIPSGPAHPPDQVMKAGAQTPLRRTVLWVVQGVASVAPQVVGVRDQESGRCRVFTVYHPSPGRAPDGDPPDPDLPPAGPAQSGARARLVAANEIASDWPHTRAA